MNVNFQTAEKGGKSATTEWYTPEYIIESLGGKFDLDPCAPKTDWYTANRCFTKDIDGLSKDWEGRVFLNPPYTILSLSILFVDWPSMETELLFFTLDVIIRCSLKTSSIEQPRSNFFVIVFTFFVQTVQRGIVRDVVPS